MRYLLLVCTIGFAFSGCAAIEDYHYCFVNQRRAASAWSASHSRQDRREFSSDYAHGWRSGYFDVSTGGCGEPPAIPPNKYWSTRYQCEAGQAVIADWYAGFQDGAIAAEADGSGSFHWIPTGPTVPTETVGWMAGEYEGGLIGPSGESPQSTDGSNHFLQPFQPLSTWPSLQPSEVAATVKIPELLPVLLATPQSVLSATPQSVLSATPHSVLSATPQQPSLPPAPVKSDVNAVPPVVTEE